MLTDLDHSGERQGALRPQAVEIDREMARAERGRRPGRQVRHRPARHGGGPHQVERRDVGPQDALGEPYGMRYTPGTMALDRPEPSTTGRSTVS
ncbi:hypothetical protein [Streptomyces hundungensis]|uniref:hypothetical protein n=1 Tax=Streptomyces hundungensis TaxID=1077946 RepID=UPI0033C0C21A